uniref:F-box domain-containing protein n=1 Tax=Eptatretus burgeri TaxID=7764 RepID=A0A8C4R8S7_EPTBU
MPFLGKDWRSPGRSWVKTSEGWTVIRGCCAQDETTEAEAAQRSGSAEDKENWISGNNEKCFESASKKRRKELANIKAQNCDNDKWICVHKCSTKERHGYCTLGEAFTQLDFSSAIKDGCQFRYIIKLLQLIANTQLTSLSGIAQKNYFTLLDMVIVKVLAEQQNVQAVRGLLAQLDLSISSLVRCMGRLLLIGNVGTWCWRLDTVRHWQAAVSSLQVSGRVDQGLTLSDLPLTAQLSILRCLDDGRDVVRVGHTTRSLHALSHDRSLWKALCHYHFTDRQVQKHIVIGETGAADWMNTYVALQKRYPRKEQYPDSLLYCQHCSILFWKDLGHPCSANNPESSSVPISPQDFIDLFRF